MSIYSYPHRRYNILTGEWILVSPQRMKRPWQGEIEASEKATRPGYDPDCYLCPGNTRASGENNPDYSGTHVFLNDFSAIIDDIPSAELKDNKLLIAQSESGVCKVICYTPRHDLTLAGMSEREIQDLIAAWTSEYLSLGGKENINYVQIFENKGSMMGCSNPHPHGQIWAQSSIPVEPEKETRNMLQHYQKHAACLLCEYLRLELESEDRVVLSNDDFVAVVPYWAVWPFEIMILSRRHISHLGTLRKNEIETFANILKRVTLTYDNLFNISFPYSSGIHQMPTDGKKHAEWHLHMHFYPPMLRSATIKKFMVGYEMMANPQRDITAEASASRLRAVAV